MNLKLITNERQTITLFGDNEVVYQPEEFTGTMDSVIINGGMPIKLETHSIKQEEIILPLGWHKGKLKTFTIPSSKIQIICVNFYDDSSCLIIDDDINRAYKKHKQLFLAVAIGTQWKCLDLLRQSIFQMKNSPPLSVIKSVYSENYMLRVVE